MMDDEFENLVGGKPIPVQLVIVAAHRAVVAVLPAKTRHLDHTAHEDFAPKAGIALVPGHLMKRSLRRTRCAAPAHRAAAGSPQRSVPRDAPAAL